MGSATDAHLPALPISNQQVRPVQLQPVFPFLIQGPGFFRLRRSQGGRCANFFPIPAVLPALSPFPGNSSTAPTLDTHNLAHPDRPLTTSCSSSPAQSPASFIGQLHWYPSTSDTVHRPVPSCRTHNTPVTRTRRAPPKSRHTVPQTPTPARYANSPSPT